MKWFLPDPCATRPRVHVLPKEMSLMRHAPRSIRHAPRSFRHAPKSIFFNKRNKSHEPCATFYTPSAKQCIFYQKKICPMHHVPRSMRQKVCFLPKENLFFTKRKNFMFFEKRILATAVSSWRMAHGAWRLAHGA